MKIIDDLKLNFLKAEGLFRLMAVNVAVFLIMSLLKLIFFLAGDKSGGLHNILEWVSLPASLGQLAVKPWTLISYMFVHENFFHILFNLIILFWAGKLFCDMLGSSRVVVVYLLGGLWGALLYVLMYNIMPVFADSVHLSMLIGASAGVIAVLCAIAALVPDYIVHLIFLGPVRLKYVAIFLVLLYLVSIPDGNAGGNISHLGGALYGFLYTRSLKAGGNPGSWLEKLLGRLTSAGKPKLKMVHRNQTGGSYRDPSSRQEVIDAILDKISRSGYSSLSAEEKEVLFRASKNTNPEK